MIQKRHILLTGARGAGKSTLIRKLCAASGMPVYGFVTKREAADAAGFHPIYIHPAGALEADRRYEAANLTGTCNSKVHRVHLEALDVLGAAYLNAAQPGGILVMDELGFMEAEAQAFQKAVFDALAGTVPVLAAIKDREDVPFLQAVRAHPNALLYTVTPKTRDMLFETLLPQVLAWRETDPLQ